MQIVMALSVDPHSRPAAVEFVEAPPWQWLRDAVWETARQWRFEPNDTYPPTRMIPLTFRFRTLPWSSPREELEPEVNGCSVEVRAYAFSGRFRSLSSIPPQYRYLYEGYVGSGGTAQTRANLPYDSITLERTPTSTVTLY